MDDKEGILFGNRNRITAKASSSSSSSKDLVEGRSTPNYSTDTTLINNSKTAASTAATSAVSGLSTPRKSSSVGEIGGGVVVRRSIRPKPAAETLMSTPPAIKFYESTFIRKPVAPKPSKDYNNLESIGLSLKDNKNFKNANSNANNNNINNPTSKVLKLRLSASDSSINSGKENLHQSGRKNLRLVKLMMPEEDSRSTPTKRSRNVSPQRSLQILPLLAPKPNSFVDNNNNDDNNVGVAVDNVKKIRRNQSEFIKSREGKLSTRSSQDEKPMKFSQDEKPMKFSQVEKPMKFSSEKPMKFSSEKPMKFSSEKPIKFFSEKPIKVADIVNEDVCGSCGGLGNFICCDACPRSFHFTCAEPPLDPQNLPEDDWFCSECLFSRRAELAFESESAGGAAGPIWSLMKRSAERMNPKCFVMPRRFRYQPKEEDLLRLQNGSFKPKNKPDFHDSLNPAAPTFSEAPIVIDQVVEIDNCGAKLKVPRISSFKNNCSGYCHFCGRYGVTRTGLTKLSDDFNDDTTTTTTTTTTLATTTTTTTTTTTAAAVAAATLPSNPKFHRPLLSCTICPLYWHLDCLDPPLVGLPSTSLEATWICPIHLTTEKCLALEIGEPLLLLLQSTLLLPESAILTQFSHKIQRQKQTDDQKEEEEEKVDLNLNLDDTFEIVYGMRRDKIKVPENIRQLYQK